MGNKIKRGLWQFLDVFKSDSGHSHSNEELTNRRLLVEFVELFQSKLENLSVGRRMLYPMSFNIVMHEADYANLKETLRFTLAEVVSEFGRCILKYSDQFPNFTPPAKEWAFQISESKLERIPLGGDNVLEIKRGEIAVIEAGIYTFDVNGADCVKEDVNLRVSFKANNSDVYSTININPETLLGFDSLSEGAYRFPFDNTLSKTSDELLGDSNSEGDAYAELSYSSGGSKYTFTMKDDLIDISGSDETRSGRSIFKIKDSHLINRHIQIKYLNAEKRFQIVAYGKARLNGRKIETSVGSNIIWYDLANNSKIFINDEVSVTFKQI
ncbi:MAG: hypothetical protein SNH13_04490 [Rikenellaceae bacterium]